MKILYHILNPNVNAAERWIFDAWRDGFESLGHQVDILTFGEDIESRLSICKPDLFMSDLCVLDLERDFKTLQSARKCGTKVAIWIHWPPAGSAQKNRQTLIQEDVADIYFGEREEDAEAFFNDTGKTYYCIPQAANPLTHKSSDPNPQFACDVLYIGTRLPKKRWLEDNVLLPLMSDPAINVRVVGLGWEPRDFIRRAALKLCKFFGFASLKNRIDKSTVKIPPEMERLYYASAKICLNFHEREEDGSQPHYIVNQRTFKIPACGGFQICDDVPAIRKYFTEDEVVLLPLNRTIWLSTIYRYLNDDRERDRIRINGESRAMRDHLSTNRCTDLLHIANLG